MSPFKYLLLLEFMRGGLIIYAGVYVGYLYTM